MAKYLAKGEVEAEQWMPGKVIEGVTEGTKIASGGEPEVTHGLLLIPGLPPLQIKDKDGVPTKARVGDTISAGRAHLDLPEGDTIELLPGDWLVSEGGKKVVLTDAEFQAKYVAAA